MIYKAAFVIVVSYLFHQVSCRKYRHCLTEGAWCHPEYMCPCCNKLYFEDGTDQDIPNNVGLFCNMAGAIMPKPNDQQFPRGCCQRCTTESDGCTDEYTPCCQDYIPVQDPSCPAGQTKCQKPDSIPTFKDSDNVSHECRGKVPDCFAEGQACDALWVCCKGLTCDRSASRTTWGICKIMEGYTGEMDPAWIPLPLPVAPASPKCPTFVNVTTAPVTIAITTGPETLAPSTASPVPDGQSTQVPVPDGQSTQVPVPDGQSTQVPVPDCLSTQVSVPDGQSTQVPVPDGQSTQVPVPDGQSTQVPVPDGQSTQVPVPDGQSKLDPVPEGPSTTGPVTSDHLDCNQPPPTPPPQPQGCQPEGGYCDDCPCCENLKCPENWWPLWILRWLLNWIGLWYRRCRNYSPLTWYNPFTWYDY